MLNDGGREAAVRVGDRAIYRGWAVPGWQESCLMAACDLGSLRTRRFKRTWRARRMCNAHSFHRPRSQSLVYLAKPFTSLLTTSEAITTTSCPCKENGGASLSEMFQERGLERH